MRKIGLIIITILGLQLQSHAQSEYFRYGKQILDTLASEWLYGRGYIEEGEKKAAYIVATEFTKMKMKWFVPTLSYYHNFSYPVNAFPTRTYIALDEKFIDCGFDYIPRPDCPTIKGEYKLSWIDSATFYNVDALKKLVNTDLSRTFLVVDDQGIHNKDQKELLEAIRNGLFPCAGVVDLKDKLTFSVSQTVSKIPVIEILRTKISRSVQTIRLNIESVHVDKYPTQNVIGYLEGKEVIDTFLVFSAHYDHLGMIGNVMFPGANDNASGVGMMLALAKYFAQPENRPKYTCIFVAFGGEEAGLVGSKELAEGKIFSLSRIKFMLNMDIMGTGDEGITVVNATEHPAEFDTLLKINEQHQYVPQIRSRGKAMNSDHYYFSEKGVKAFFIYTNGGIKAYHDVYDRRETLPLTKFDEIHQLITEFVKTFR